MARGWESKAVEAQQADADITREVRPTIDPQDAERERRRTTLRLARTQVLGELQRACSPAHRGMLEQAIVDLDHQLALLA